MPGLRANNFGDLDFADHANAKVKGLTFNVFIVVDGGATFVSAYDSPTRESHATGQCLTEWMDTFHITQ